MEWGLGRMGPPFHKPPNTSFLHDPSLLHPSHHSLPTLYSTKALRHQTSTHPPPPIQPQSLSIPTKSGRATVPYETLVVPLLYPSYPSHHIAIQTPLHYPFLHYLTLAYPYHRDTTYPNHTLPIPQITIPYLIYTHTTLSIHTTPYPMQITPTYPNITISYTYYPACPYRNLPSLIKPFSHPHPTSNILYANPSQSIPTQHYPTTSFHSSTPLHFQHAYPTLVEGVWWG